MAFVSLDEIRDARERIRPMARETPLIDVSGMAGRPLWLKCESLQPGGAFKIRGAYNMVAQLSPAARRRGVITYSSGNHGQAVAIAARDRKSTRLNSSHRTISYAVFCLKKKN